MKKSREEWPALLVIDMVKDNFDEERRLPITPHARKIVGPINEMARAFRANQWPVVFSTDAFHRDDFIFQASMKPHSLAGTDGARVVEDLAQDPGDLWLPKPRFSAFFRTGLENWLRERGVTLCAVAGISTHFCVLTTAMDALCHGFKTVLLEDCAAAPSEEVHTRVLDLYRRNPIYPLFRVATSRDLLRDLLGTAG